MFDRNINASIVLNVSGDKLLAHRVQYFFKIVLILTAPVIISAPRDSYGPLGANLTLDCEARGYPAPTITWQFHSNEGKTYNLPSKFRLGLGAGF